MSTCEQRDAIDIAWLRRQGLLEPGRTGEMQFSRRGAVTGAVRVSSAATGISLAYRTDDAKDVGQFISFKHSPQPFGGHRVWLQCPHCDKQCRVLYSGRLGFRCRRCQGLSYISEHERPFGRAILRPQRLRERLGGSADLTQPFPPKPKGMHWRTYRRLEERDQELLGAIISRAAV